MSNTYINCEPIQLLLESGPDAMTNMWDIYFKTSVDFAQVKDKNGVPSTWKNLFDFYSKDASLKPMSLCARIQDVTIPGIKSEVDDVNFLSRLVTRQTGDVTHNQKVSFSIRLDEDLRLLTLMNDVYGNLGLQTFDSDVVKKEDLAKIHEVSHVWQSFFKRNKIYNVSDVKNYCIVRPCYCGPVVDGDSYSVQQISMPYFVFEDIKFLGGGELTFDQTSPEPTTVKFDFIFRRMRRLPGDDLHASYNGKYVSEAASSYPNDNKLPY